tara:strand:- start:298 stop:852 length:555 start_codon:yes stop_codon:yes gene_type:complete
MRLINTVSVCVLLAAAHAASGDIRASISQCAGLEDLELRLACFDAVKQATATDPATELGKALHACSGGELGRLDCYDGVVREHGLGPMAKVQLAARSESKSAEPPAKTVIPKTFSSVLTGVRRGMTGVFRLELENGQVWRELEPTPGSNYRVGDELTFKKGLFGAYRMKNERTNIGTKVKVLRR